MNVQVCPRPGWAKRGGGFETLKQECEGALLSPITRIDLDRAIAQGTPSLSAGARCLLMFYASHLSVDGIKKNQTSVYPGTARATACLGVSPATLRRHKAELEEAGFIIRCYDRRNRPLEAGAIELYPLLIKIPTILSELTAQLEDQRGDWHSTRLAEEASSLSTQERKDERLNRAKKSTENSSVVLKIEGGGDGQAPKPKPIEPQAANPKLIKQVLRHSPKLRVALPEGFEPGNPGATDVLRAALPDLFPNESAGSIGHTGLWAEQRLGPAMFAAVAIAIEDPEVRRPAAYLGRLVTKAEGYDPTENLKRLVELNPALVELERHGDLLSDRLLEGLADQIGEAAATSWFGRGRVRFALHDTTLLVETSGSFATQRIRERYLDELTAVASEEGALQVEVTRAGDSHRPLRH